MSFFYIKEGNGSDGAFRTSEASPPSIYVRCCRAATRVMTRAAEQEQQPVFTWFSPFSSRESVPCEIVEVKHTHGLTDQLPWQCSLRGRPFPFMTLLMTLP